MVAVSYVEFDKPLRQARRGGKEPDPDEALAPLKLNPNWAIPHLKRSEPDPDDALGEYAVNQLVKDCMQFGTHEPDPDDALNMFGTNEPDPDEAASRHGKSEPDPDEALSQVFSEAKEAVNSFRITAQLV